MMTRRNFLKILGISPAIPYVANAETIQTPPEQVYDFGPSKRGLVFICVESGEQFTMKVIDTVTNEVWDDKQTYRTAPYAVPNPWIAVPVTDRSAIRIRSGERVIHIPKNVIVKTMDTEHRQIIV